MNAVILTLLALAAVAVVWVSRRFVRILEGDGLGHRPVPRSHHEDPACPFQT